MKLTLTDQFVEELDEHTHPPSATACEVAKVKAAVLKKAETSNDSNRQIFASELSGITHIYSCCEFAVYGDTVPKYSGRDMPSHPLNRAAIPILLRAYEASEMGEDLLLYASEYVTLTEYLSFHLSKRINFYQILSTGMPMTHSTSVQN